MFFKIEGVNDRDDPPEKKSKSVSVAATDTDSGSDGNSTGTDDSDVRMPIISPRTLPEVSLLGRKKQRKSGIDPSWLKSYPWLLKLGDKVCRLLFIYLFNYLNQHYSYVLLYSFFVTSILYLFKSNLVGK